MGRGRSQVGKKNEVTKFVDKVESSVNKFISSGEIGKIEVKGYGSDKSEYTIERISMNEAKQIIKDEINHLENDTLKESIKRIRTEPSIDILTNGKKIVGIDDDFKMSDINSVIIGTDRGTKIAGDNVILKRWRRAGILSKKDMAEGKEGVVNNYSPFISFRKSKIVSNKPVKYNGKTYKDIGNAKLSKPKRLTDWGTSTSKKRENSLLNSLPEINKVPKGWVAVEGDGTGGNIPAGYALISNNKSRFGGKRETALIKYEKAKKAGIIER